ncbi:MAG: RNA polymerase sigma factor [Solirubrobacteraceae bacterium]
MVPSWRRLGSDEMLVAGVRDGDERAFEAIVDRYDRPLLSFCRHMLGSREEGEDALQQTFLGAYRDLVSSTKPIRLRPWLYAIARNQCLSILRARREKLPLDDAEPATDGLAAEVQQREDLRNMLVDLARLPDDQRAALVLAELGSLSHAEIAATVGCPREKVKALVFQARGSLAASRRARETPCSEVRQQLATLAGGALRRGPLRRHVRQCAGCRAFEAEVRRQRRAMAVLLPVVPSAGLKTSILAGAGLGGGGGAVVGAGALGGLGGGGAGKLIAVGLIAAGAGTGGAIVLRSELRNDSPRAAAAAPAPSASGQWSWGVTRAARVPAARIAARRLPATAAHRAGSSARAHEAARAAPAAGRVARGRSGGRRAGVSARATGTPTRGRSSPRRPGHSLGRSGHTPGSGPGAPGSSGDAPGRSVEPPARSDPPTAHEPGKLSHRP